MSKITLCDVCGNDLHIENQHAEFKIPKAYWRAPHYDGTVGGAYWGRSKLDICFNCWHEFRKFVEQKQSSRGDSK